MRRNIAYFKYVIKHKWFVLLASIKIGVSIKLALIHDLSKFTSKEWGPYAKTFFDSTGNSRFKKAKGFDLAWSSHFTHNPHHWNYWLTKQDNGCSTPIEMPHKYVLEMVADWMGAGRAITGKWEYKEWYNQNKHKMKLHPKTMVVVEEIMNGL